MDFFKSDRQVTTAHSGDNVSKICDFEHGGLNATSLEGAIRNLNTIKYSDLGKEGGIPILDANGKVKLTDIELNGFIVPMLNHAGAINPGSTYSTYITNYDSETRYDIRVTTGDVNVEGKNITVAVPSTYNDETFDITVNGFVNTINVNVPRINKPTILNLRNEDVVFKELSIEMSSFVVVYALGGETHTSTDIQLATDSEFTELEVNLQGYTTTRTSYTFNNLENGRTYYLRVRYNSDEVRRPSQWSDVIMFSTLEATISRPSIVYPANNATSIFNQQFRLKTTDFETNEDDDNKVTEHTVTEILIATDDSFINPIATIKHEDAESLTDILVKNKLPTSQTGSVYIKIRYLAEDGNRSAWSEPVSVSLVADVTDGSGRKFHRHESNMGTVMTWVDKTNVTRQTLILDAPYRNRLRWASSDINVTNISDFNQGNTGYYPGGASVNTTATSITFVNDTTINTNSNYREDSKTSRENTTAMLQHTQCQGTSYAGGWCRSKTISHEGNSYTCDLPNIQTLVRIFYSMFKLDELDPTANGNVYLFTRARSNNSYNWYLGNNSSYSYTSWSSSESSTNNGYPHTIHYNGMLYSSSHVNKSGYYCGTIPVLELENL